MVSLLLLLILNFDRYGNLMKGTRLRLSEDDADTSKHVGVLAIYRILFIYIYIYWEILLRIINRTS
jgi:hypothetical protein